jgi:hypothetical protein
MKVLLREDIRGVGRRGDVVEVAGGYARNFLFPGGKALEANGKMEEQAESMRKSRDMRDAKDRAAAQAQSLAPVDARRRRRQQAARQRWQLSAGVCCPSFAAALAPTAACSCSSTAAPCWLRSTGATVLLATISVLAPGPAVPAVLPVRVPPGTAVAIAGDTATALLSSTGTVSNLTAEPQALNTKARVATLKKCFMK